MPQPSPVQRAHVLPEEGHDCEACLPIPPRSSGREMWIDKADLDPFTRQLATLPKEIPNRRAPLPHALGAGAGTHLDVTA